MTYNKHFWYDGLHAQIEMVGRERYESYLNGEQFARGGHSSNMRDDLITEMKYRVESEYDFYLVCHAVCDFIDQQVPGRNGNNEFVLRNSIDGEVVLNDRMLVGEVLHVLEMNGYIERHKAYDSPNYQLVISPEFESVPTRDELETTVERLWGGGL